LHLNFLLLNNMKIIININDVDHLVDHRNPIDISIPLHAEGPRAWYVPKMRFSPVINSQFAGSVKLGGSVNFFDVQFNPHGHGTHTESMGHITMEQQSVNKALKEYFFVAQLISVTPEIVAQATPHLSIGDRVITAEQLRACAIPEGTNALVIRTLPNSDEKLAKNYSNTNFPYFTEAALRYVAEIGVEHLLVDLPSVDREEDGGLLLAHRAFWNFPSTTRAHCTITEFVFVRDEIEDGMYLLNLQVAPFENDAASSRPVLYRI